MGFNLVFKELTVFSYALKAPVTNSHTIPLSFMAYGSHMVCTLA